MNSGKKSSSIRRLAMVKDGKPLLMLVLRAYLDESGHSRDKNVKAVTMAGAISWLPRWESFEGKWEEALKASKVSYLHMKEFAHSRGEFKNWRNLPKEKREYRRRRLMGSLLKVAKNNVITYIGAAISLRVYKQAPELHLVLKDPYYGCFLHCLIEACKVASEIGPYQKVQIVCDSHKEFSALAVEVFNQAKEGLSEFYDFSPLDSITFASFRDTSPLQLADLAAYEMHKLLSRRIRGIQIYRYPMEQIAALSHGHMRLIGLRNVNDRF